MTPSPLTPEQRAKQRYFFLTFLRLMGVGIAMFGVMIAAGKFGPIPEENRMLVGTFFILAGIVETIWIPIAMTRAWRSNGE